MKKLTSFALIFATTAISALTGCSNKDPYAVYNEALENNSSIESISFQNETLYTIKAQDQDVSSTTTTNVKRINEDDNDPSLGVNIVYSMNDESYGLDAVYNNGYLYVSSGDSKMKRAMTYDEAISQVEGNGFSFPKDIIDGSKTAKSNGVTSIEFTFNPTKVKDLLDSDLVSLRDALGVDSNSLTINSASMKADVDSDKRLISSSLAVDAIMVSNDDTTVPFVYELNCDYSDFGNTTVTIPDDLDSYVEVNEDLGEATEGNSSDNPEPASDNVEDVSTSDSE